MKKWLLPSLGLLMLATSCNFAPRRVDPFPSLALKIPYKYPPYKEPDAANQGQPYKNLTVAVVWSENTKKCYEIGKKYEQNSHTNTEQNFEHYMDLFRKNFKTAVRVDKIEDASGVNADLVAVLDIVDEKMTMNPIGMSTTLAFDSGAFFLGLDGSLIDTAQAKAAGSGSVREYGSSSGGTGLAQRVTDDSIRKLGIAILSSAKVAELNKSKGG